MNMRKKKHVVDKSQGGNSRAASFNQQAKMPNIGGAIQTIENRGP